LNFMTAPAESGKKDRVRAMFDNIAPRYDLLNRVLSAGIDQSWRRKAVGLLREDAPARVLDVATGTADLAIMAAERGAERVVGVDIAEEMLELGREKVRRKGLDERIILQQGDAEKLPFSDRQFDAALVAFGVRNFEELDRGLSEIGRVLRPGGRIVVLEFSKPRTFPVKQLYDFYGRRILPVVGRLVSGDPAAYTYLPESIRAFPDGDAFLSLLGAAGFNETRCVPLTFGIASIYTGLAA
jgi:demethylmenaquinone methyltransferase/2-methoxy-6-polyprenyl-1,4-benzoquinol methylase